MSRKTSISRLLRAVKRRGDRVVAQDTTPPLSSSPDVTAADAAARSQAPVPSATSTCSGREADTQCKPVGHGNEGPVMDSEKWVQDTEAGTTTDSPLVHRIINGVHKLVDSASRLHLRPKSPLDTSLDHNPEVLELPDPLACCSGTHPPKSEKVRYASAPDWARQKSSKFSRRRMARRLKKCRLFLEELTLLPLLAVTDNSDLPPLPAFVRLPTTRGSPLVIHHRAELGGMPVALKFEESQGFGPVVLIYGFVMQQ
jgi:hypothetical protein